MQKQHAPTKVSETSKNRTHPTREQDKPHPQQHTPLTTTQTHTPLASPSQLRPARCEKPLNLKTHSQHSQRNTERNSEKERSSNQQIDTWIDKMNDTKAKMTLMKSVPRSRVRSATGQCLR
mmetsp:Transcript_2198/g.4018  ORF Transcript_2198/g.4018 Transcript_2198/m.4018 type:complete len:121 (-) Transcript_2198:28-390(-)